MFRYFDFKVIFFIFANIVFAHILSEINSEVAPYIYFAVPALYIVPSALFLNFIPMLFTVAFTAFFVEASTPLRAGSTATIWLLASFVVHGMRFRFRTLDWFSLSALYVGLNFVILFLYCVFFPKQADSFSTYVVRTASDALCSSVLLMLIGRFSLSIPIALANFCGVNLSISEDKQ